MQTLLALAVTAASVFNEVDAVAAWQSHGAIGSGLALEKRRLSSLPSFHLLPSFLGSRGDFLQNNSAQQWHPIRVACLGDSITIGIPGPPDYSYPTRLQQLLGPGYVVSNFGRGWSSLMPPLPGFPPEVQAYETTPEFTAAVNSQPNVVILMLGANDARGSWTEERSQAFVLHYVTLINKLRQPNSALRVLIGIQPPCYCTTSASRGDQPDRHQYNAVGNQPVLGINQTIINAILPRLANQVVQSAGLSTAFDTFTLFSGRCPGPDHTKASTCEWMADALHPSESGYLQIAALVNQTIAA